MPVGVVRASCTVMDDEDDILGYDATAQPARHEGKSDKKKEACAPDGMLSRQSSHRPARVLVDQVDHEDIE
jgi:hypothetical protein